MALIATQTQTCDRCQRPVKEMFLKQGDSVPVIKRTGCKFITTSSDSKNPGGVKEKVVFEYADLCESCKSAIDSLMDRVTLAPKKPKTAKKSTATTEVGPKNKPEKEESDVSKVVDEQPSKPKRGRGRPSKDEVVSKQSKRGRGRPPKQMEEPEEDYTEEEAVEEEQATDDTAVVGGDQEFGADEEESLIDEDGEDEEENLIEEILSEESSNLVEDPETHDIYNMETGEIVQTSEDRKKAKSKAASKSTPKTSVHPF
jgi:hypothetical protein